MESGFQKNHTRLCDGHHIYSENNAKDFAVTAASGVKRAVDEDGITFLIQPANKMQPAAKVPTSPPQITMMGTADASSENCIHGGEATVEYDDSTGHIHTAHLTNCSYGEGIQNSLVRPQDYLRLCIRDSLTTSVSGWPNFEEDVDPQHTNGIDWVWPQYGQAQSTAQGAEQSGASV
ncbi:MAG: hypothetical protein KZQ78_06230 [Candidatus Thiodiazotropha sp. (ex Ustalcina ferruginea)]|nr:hypothetical protein [Candidatus Thiodiazotropha sp. (ex Ustalcina ferruginea)]